MIVVFDLCDKHAEAILPRRGVVKRSEAIIVPIITDAVTRNKTKVKLPEAQLYAKQTTTYTHSIFESKTTRLGPDSWTWVKG